MLSRSFKLLIISICIFVAATAQAQITTDGTLGQPAALTGPHYRIGAELGKQAGGNLFHSFGQFNVNTDESATFTGPNSVENIISRVTGGKASLIDGWLRSEIPGANLYFLNPAGVLFGKNAALDIGGSFHVSTADYLRLGESGRFDATQPEASNLSVDPPSAFGFLSDNPKGVSVEGVLRANPGETLSVTGGDIEISGGALAVLGGQVHIAAVASPGEVFPTDSGPEITSSGNLGRISLSQGAQINVNGDPSGDIYIRGGQFEIKDQGTSLVSMTGNSDGGDIDIRVSEDMAVRDGAAISATGFGDGKSGNITLNAANLKMTGGGIADTTVTGAGQGGAISASAGSVEISGYGQSYKSGLYAETGGAGDAGSVSVSADELAIADNGIISGLTVGEGKGGDVSLNVKKMEVSSGGSIDTGSRKSGVAGNISVTAGSVEISGYGQLYKSGLYAETGDAGDAGSISVSADELILSDNGTISALTKGAGNGGDVSFSLKKLDINDGGAISTAAFGAGRSGNISVTASESATVSGTGILENDIFKSYLDASTYGNGGDGGDISVMTDRLTVSDNGLIQSVTKGSGQGGDVLLNADRLEVSGGGTIDTSSRKSGAGGNISIIANESVSISGKGDLLSNLDASAYGSGDGGKISVIAKDMDVSDGGVVQNSSAGKGRGGDVLLNADRLEISRGGQILTNIFSSGQGGNISITARETVAISGEGESGESGLYADAMPDSTGDAGNISVTTGILTVTEQGKISGITGGAGNGGNIAIQADDLTVSDNGLITNGTSGAGNGGNIAIQADDLTVSDNGLITNGTSGAGNGGNITVETERLDMDRGYISSGTEVEKDKNTGHGGDIKITASDSVNISGSGQNDEGLRGEYYGIYSQTQGDGDGGNITVRTDELNLTKDAMINAQTYGNGKGGDVRLEVGSLTLDSGGFVTTSTRGAGDSGDISVTAKESVSISGAGVKIEKGSTIYSATHSSGSGGDITVSSPVLKLEDKGRMLAGTVLSDDPEENLIPSGPGGDITLDVGRLQMNRNASISSESHGTGDAGDIAVRSAETIQISNSTVTTEAENAGGGRIAIAVGELLSLSDSQMTTSVRYGAGNGGDISVTEPEFFTLNHSSIIARAYEGKGGNIHLVADQFIRSSGSEVDASSALGIDGKIEIDSPEADISSGLTILPADVLDVTQWLPLPCTQRYGKNMSSFVITGKEGIPYIFDDLQPSPP